MKIIFTDQRQHSTVLIGNVGGVAQQSIHGAAQCAQQSTDCAVSADLQFHALRVIEYFLPGQIFGSLNSIFRSEEHTSELQSRGHLVCRLLLEKKKIRTRLLRNSKY